jgi:hypothetical protein
MGDVENVAGGSELVLLTWSRNGTDVFSITELQLISPDWGTPDAGLPVWRTGAFPPAADVGSRHRTAR